MSIKVNCNEGKMKHELHKVYAFIDRKNAFYLVDEDCEHIILLTDKSCIVYDCDSYTSVEDFLDTEFGCGILKIFERGEDYEIIVNG